MGTVGAAPHGLGLGLWAPHGLLHSLLWLSPLLHMGGAAAGEPPP